MFNTGFVYESPSDIEVFLNNIKEGEYEELSMNCLRYARNNSWDVMRQKCFQLYKELQ